MYIIITASPNADGLTASCGKAALEGFESAGGKAEIIDISALKLEPCRICGDGWGKCRTESKCVINDSLAEIQEKMSACEGVVLVSPVYFGQPSERMKYFLDRFRRCGGAFGRKSVAGDKQIDLIAAAGGSGNGTATCLAEMETWCRQVSAIAGERIGVTRFNRAAVLPVIKDAAARMVKGEYFKRG